MDSKTPGWNLHLWHIRHRRVANCSRPVYGNDAVTLDFFNNLCPKMKAQEGLWSFVNYRLTDVAEPHNMDDAVTKRYLKSALLQFAQSLVKTIGTNDPLRDTASFKNALENTLSSWI